MRKLTLRLDALEVDSFEASSLDQSRSTVHGNEITAFCGTGQQSDCCETASRFDPTCEGYQTCFVSCPGYPTCYEDC
jgi:hypothetical protein